MTGITGSGPPRPGRTFDVHVHPWPPRLYRAMLRWFDEHAWRIHDRVDGDGVDAFLEERGVDRYVALIYAHKAGMARDLNHWMSEYARRHPRAVPAAAVHPDDDVEAVLTEAFDVLGLRLLKLHAHVTGIAPDDPRLDPVYAMLSERGIPLVFHSGNAPAVEGYPRPVEEVSGVARLRPVLRRFPDLDLVLPHLGAGEFDAVGELLAEHPRLHLDTTMVVSGYFPGGPGREFLLQHHTRIMYGTDFPILPYEYDRERRVLQSLELPADVEDAILYGNAARLYGTEVT